MKTKDLFIVLFVGGSVGRCLVVMAACLGRESTGQLLRRESSNAVLTGVWNGKSSRIRGQLRHK